MLVGDHFRHPSVTQFVISELFETIVLDRRAPDKRKFTVRSLILNHYSFRSNRVFGSLVQRFPESHYWGFHSALHHANFFGQLLWIYTLGTIPHKFQQLKIILHTKSNHACTSQLARKTIILNTAICIHRQANAYAIKTTKVFS